MCIWMAKPLPIWPRVKRNGKALQMQCSIKIGTYSFLLPGVLSLRLLPTDTFDCRCTMLLAPGNLIHMPGFEGAMVAAVNSHLAQTLLTVCLWLCPSTFPCHP